MSKSPRSTQLYKSEVDTDLGPMLAVASDKGLVLLEFHDRKRFQFQINTVTRIFNSDIVPKKLSIFSDLQTQLDRYFEGTQKNFNISLDIPATEFQILVWNELLKIPFGQTKTYGEIAHRIDNVKAVRAVGKANGDNRISVIIPCHRLIGKSGKLTGYGGGLWRKQRLLDLEKEFSI